MGKKASEEEAKDLKVDNTKIEAKEAKKQEKAKLKEEKKQAKEVAKTEEVKNDDTNKVEEKALIKKMRRANNDKIIILSIVLGVIIIAVAIFGIYFYKANVQSVVTFDGGKITKAEYSVYYKTFAPMLQYWGYPESIIPEQIAEKAGMDKMLLIDAKAAGITLSAENKAKVDEAFANKEQTETWLSQGIDLGLMRQLYESDYIISDYMTKMKNDITDDQMKEYIKSVSGENANLTEYNTRHILFKTTDASTGTELAEDKVAEAKAKAEDTLKRVLAGEDFEKLAKELSEDGTKEDGGKFVMYMDGRIMKEYSDAVLTLKDGQIHATLVKTEAGYHIIKLDSKVENGRLKSDDERGSLVDKKIDEMKKAKNLKVDTAMMNKLVESITGKPVATGEDENTNNEDNTNTENKE